MKFQHCVNGRAQAQLRPVTVRTLSVPVAMVGFIQKELSQHFSTGQAVNGRFTGLTT